MRVVFMGSAELACPALMALATAPGLEVGGVVTQPDRPKGRNLGLSACRAKLVAEVAGLNILTPPKVNAPESMAALQALAPELIVVAAYGQILGKTLLALPARGCINVHASLLPRYRGAAPIQWAIANGDAETGVTTMLMNPEMDGGDILLQEPVAIGEGETAGELHERLARTGAALLLRTLEAWRAGTLVARAQDAGQVTFAPKLRKPDGQIDWTRAAREIYNRIRAFNPWPGSYCAVRGAGEAAVLKVHRVAVEAGAGPAGRVLEIGTEGPLIAAGREAVRLLEVQPPGGRVMSGAAYWRGHPVAIGQDVSS